MPPILASFLTVLFIGYLFRRDFRERPNVTGALWLPFFWVMINGGRFVSEWLAMCGLNLGGNSVEEGSPVDALVFFVLIAAGVRILYQRRVSVAKFVRHNRWVSIYLGYCLLSAVFWSDFPFVAFKRWIKLFGQPVMVLILLTEPDPLESLTRLLKRCAYVFIPVSILFIKYYPQWGRAFDAWSGLPTNAGITTNKNALGCDCFILGFFFIWHFLRVWRLEKGKPRRNELVLCLGFFVMIGWLLYMAHSSTSLGVLVLAVAALGFLGLKFLNLRQLDVYLVMLVAACILGQFFFGIYDFAIQALGRDSTLTDRTYIWQILLHWNINPILGAGFESFWLGDRQVKFAELFRGIPINEAHNGYLETYIQLGLLGLFITLALILATYAKARRELFENFDLGRFRLAYLAGFLFFNWTEAGFRTHCFPFFMFFLAAIDYPAQTEPLETYSDELAADTANDGCPQNGLPATNPPGQTQARPAEIGHAKTVAIGAVTGPHIAII
jgi:O-antigen ligase